MNDDRDLLAGTRNRLAGFAREARQALASATMPTLLIQGVGRLGPDDRSVVLHDHDGVPVFLCEQGSPVCAAARERRAALLTIPSSGRSGEVLAISFAGELMLTRIEHVEGVSVDVVTMSLANVLVARDDPRDAERMWQEVPLELYALAEPDPMTACARRVVTHTNHAHQLDMRKFVARRLGVAIDTVAGACLANLDEYGADMRWVDATGAHTMTLLFPESARTPQELVDHLCAQLSGATIQEPR